MSSPNSLDKDVNLAQKKNVFRGASFSVSCIVTKRVNSKNGCGSNMFVPYFLNLCVGDKANVNKLRLLGMSETYKHIYYIL